MDDLDLEQARKLREICHPVGGKPAATNFEQLCAVGLAFAGMYLDQIIEAKAAEKKAAGK